ncbi:MAG: DsrE family protein [Candidatus Thermoplasmatota archaeon]|nr:DsrE family protein [Candidatus Thermoplasmatota archaeon]
MVTDMEKILFVLNDPPYGSEHTYNALRLAISLLKGKGDLSIRMFLQGDAAPAAKSGQEVPKGYYSIELMLRSIARRGGVVGVCGTCMDARGISDTELMEGAERSSLDELTKWTLWADKVISF